jgi:hypothetical protein
MAAKQKNVWWRQLPQGKTLYLKASGLSGIATALIEDTNGRRTVDDTKLRKGYSWPLANGDTTDVHVWCELAGKAPTTLTIIEEVREPDGTPLRANTYDATLTTKNPDDVATVTASVA